LRAVILEQLVTLERIPVDALVEARYRRYRTLGAYTEVETAPATPAPDRIGFGDRLRKAFDPGRWSGVGLPGQGRGRDEPPAREEV
jgi:hypothetical protein